VGWIVSAALALCPVLAEAWGVMVMWEEIHSSAHHPVIGVAVVSEVHQPVEVTYNPFGYRRGVHPFEVVIGSTWMPRWKQRGGVRTPLKVLERVDRPAGTHFVVETAAPQQRQKRRLISFEALLRQYEPLQQASIEK
jgi:hypothetical protein